MQGAIVRTQGSASPLRVAVRRDCKSAASVAIYAAAIPLAFIAPVLSFACYAGVAAWWLVPDRRIEDLLRSD